MLPQTQFAISEIPDTVANDDAGLACNLALMLTDQRASAPFIVATVELLSKYVDNLLGMDAMLHALVTAAGAAHSDREFRTIANCFSRTARTLLARNSKVDISIGNLIREDLGALKVVSDTHGVRLQKRLDT